MARISFTFIKNMSIVVRIHHLFQWGSCIFRLDNFIHFLKNGLGYSALLSQSERLCKYNVDLLDQFTIFKNNFGYSIVIIYFSKMMLGIPFFAFFTSMTCCSIASIWISGTSRRTLVPTGHLSAPGVPPFPNDLYLWQCIMALSALSWSWDLLHVPEEDWRYLYLQLQRLPLKDLNHHVL